MSAFDSFFQACAAALARFDADEIAGFYHDPAVILRADGSLHVLGGRADVREFFQGVLDSAYRPWNGICAARNDTDIRRGWQSYNLLKTAARWQILVSTFHVD